ncbi:MAG: PTS sugar transporter subunit IIB [Planctomycetes bacterium]|nr:PTS sugar transporter subunit IIB [Planctomycetota bacterium]
MKIVMVCAYGMSTSLLMKKMNAAAEEKGVTVEISAHTPVEMEEKKFDCDIILLGPQVAYHKERLQTMYPNIPVAAIAMMDYGMMNGEKVLEDAIAAVTNH